MIYMKLIFASLVGYALYLGTSICIYEWGQHLYRKKRDAYFKRRKIVKWVVAIEKKPIKHLPISDYDWKNAL